MNEIARVGRQASLIRDVFARRLPFRSRKGPIYVSGWQRAGPVPAHLRDGRARFT